MQSILLYKLTTILGKCKTLLGKSTMLNLYKCLDNYTNDNGHVCRPTQL